MIPARTLALVAATAGKVGAIGTVLTRFRRAWFDEYLIAVGASRTGVADASVAQSWIQTDALRSEARIGAARIERLDNKQRISVNRHELDVVLVLYDYTLLRLYSIMHFS